MIKTFRGLLADGGQDQIRLQTIKGKVGYRILKFEGFPSTPGAIDYESTLIIWKKKQTSVSSSSVEVNFTDSDLLAAFYDSNYGSPAYASANRRVIFDNEVFNQDIYITHTNTDGANAFNYYVELEVIPLDDAGAEYTTLKDMRQA